MANALKIGNVIVVDFTATFLASGQSRTYSTVTQITSSSPLTSSIVYINDNTIVSSTSGGGMLGSVVIYFRNGTGTSGSYFRYSSTLYPQEFNGLQVTINNITVYGDVV